MKFLTPILILILLPLSLKATTNFTAKEKAIINDEAVKTVQSYAESLNKIAAGGNINVIKNLSESLIELFVSRKALVYNDLDPAHKLSEFYELETYVSNLVLWYPDGMQVKIDANNLKASGIVEHGNDIYSIDLLLEKQITGNYLNKTKNNNNEKLVLKVAFVKNGNKFENFKIAGIRNATGQYLANFANSVDEVKSMALSADELEKVQQYIKSTINDYINYLNLISDPNETSDDKSYYEISFTNLFANNEIKVYNDISPKPEKTYYNVNEYLNNFKTWYSSGIKNLAVQADTGAKSKVIPLENNKFYTHFVTEKFFSGQYKNNEIYRDNSKYDFKIVFEREGKTYKNFHIESIDKVGQDLFSADKTQVTTETPSQPIKALGRNGLFVGVSGSFGLSLIADNALTSDNTLAWSATNTLTAASGLDILYFPNSNIGLHTGFYFNQYESTYKLSGEIYDNTQLTDQNGLTYVKKLTAGFDSTLSVKALSIPIQLHFISSKMKKMGFFADFGITASFISQFKYSSSGSLQLHGYFENNPDILKEVAFTKMGFYDRTSINASKSIDKFTSLYLSLSGSIGICIPVGYFAQIMVGPSFSYGLSNLASSNKTTNLFGKEMSRKLTLIRGGIFISYSYKL